MKPCDHSQDPAQFVTSLLQHTADPFHLLFDNLRDHAVYMLDAEGRIVSWNHGAERIKGYAASEVLGQPWARLYSPEEVAQGKPQEHLALARAKGTFEEEALRTRKDGSTFWAQFTISLLTDGGRAVAFLVVVRDRTEQKRTLDRLRESEERFRLLVEGVSDYAIYMLDPNGMIITWNTGAARLFGYRADEILGKHRNILFSDEEKTARLNEESLRRAAANRSHSEEGWRIRKDGSRFWAGGTLIALRDDVGGLRGFGKVVRDLTDRKQAESELQVRNRAIQAVAAGILITDPRQPDNPIIYASPGFERLTGYSQAEVLGRNCRFLQGKDTDRAVVTQMRAAIQAGERCEVELVNYHKDGSRFWNALAISPIHDDAGEVTHFIGVQTDVTERRQLELQFRQAQKMEAVGRLAGGVAHDFNNLLTIINGYTALLLQRLLPDDPIRDLIAEVHRAGERAGTLTRQLLVFSRQSVLEAKVLDLNAVVADTEKMLVRLIGEDITLTTALEPTVGSVKVDPGQLQQALINLAVNARDAMPQGGKLTVETHEVELTEEQCQHLPECKPGRYSLLAVTDTGIGMNEATRSLIFEPFFTTKEVGKGTGLGLAMVYGFVKASNGHISVYSEPGVGTTFKLYFPQVQERAQAGKSSPLMVPMPRGHETVLLVEDDDVVRALTRHVLQGSGYQVLEASNGKEAVRLAREHAEPIHLLVTDVVMPYLGGRQVAEQVGVLKPGIKVLYCSGYTDDAVVRHGVLEAGTAFMQKPYSPSLLVQKVRDVLDGLA